LRSTHHLASSPRARRRCPARQRASRRRRRWSQVIESPGRHGARIIPGTGAQCKRAGLTAAGRARMTRLMLAIRPDAPGGPEILRLIEAATPTPGPGEALIRVEAAGVNFVDIYQRSGQYKVPPPIPLGLEGAGVVEALGDGAAGISVGERVAWASGPGSY